MYYEYNIRGKCIFSVGTNIMIKLVKLAELIIFLSAYNYCEKPTCIHRKNNKKPLRQEKIRTTRNKIVFVMFIWGLSSHSRTFQSYGDVTITGEGLQILTYAWHTWTHELSSEVSYACRTYCDKGHPFIIVISEGPWPSHLLPSV